MCIVETAEHGGTKACGDEYRRNPYTTKSSSTLRLSFTLQNGLRWSGRDDFWLGNPLTMTSLRFWYTGSSLACLQSSFKCIFSCSS